jgi:hypothetical protein
MSQRRRNGQVRKGNRLAVKDGGHSPQLLERTARDVERRFLGDAGLKREDLGTLEVAYFTDWVRAHSKVARMDSRTEWLDDEGNLPSFARTHWLTAVNTGRRNLDSIAKHTENEQVVRLLIAAYTDAHGRIERRLQELEAWYDTHRCWPTRKGYAPPTADFYFAALNTRRQLHDSIAALHRRLSADDSMTRRLQEGAR